MTAITEDIPLKFCKEDVVFSFLTETRCDEFLSELAFNKLAFNFPRFPKNNHVT